MKIMLDAGHGFNTSGKRSPDGMQEYEFNRVVANYAKQLLETYQNTKVYFAHSDSRDVPLQERTNSANKLDVDLYVSIHANAYGSTWNDASGIETYVYPSRPKISVEVAQKIQKHLISDTGRKNRGVKTADFHVLRETDMDAVLIESGFMTNREEASLLRTDSYRKKVAGAIVKGIAEQFKLVKKPVATPPPTTPPPPATNGLYKVQVGAFSDRENADDLVERLKKAGYDAYVDFEQKK